MQRTSAIDATKKIGEKIKLSGWVHIIRSHGKIIFIDLRDRSGILQLVAVPQQKEAYEIARKLKSEYVIEAEGIISERPKEMFNPNSPTGQIELKIQNLKILSESKNPPFELTKDTLNVDEEIRLKYRYLDLRSERMKNNIIMRSKVIHFMREFLQKEGFLEIETPILTKSTPEGARDYLVPSRLYPGKFYALPQSPQQYKQLLMVAGLEKYVQIARCFRDEDPRADRQAEFTQLDIEMSFVEQEDILGLIERLYLAIVKEFFPQKKITKVPFPRLKYKEVMEKYKSDKPDLRENKNDPDELAFCWIVDFPMFEWKESEKRWDAVHHPFTRPQEEDLEKIKKDPEKILAYQYDLVLNGSEIAGGSLRSYRPEILETVFEVMGHKKPDIRKKFGHLLEAFEYGVPPHGGVASGLDRFIMLALNQPNIREVMAFPKTGDSRGLMMDTPSEVSKEQLKELYISIKKHK